MIKIRDEYWSDASTKNCVWLFQTSHQDYQDRGCICEEKQVYDNSGDFNDENCTCAIITWRTERVFLKREEAKSYGESRTYAWGEEGEGWKVYGVPCDGMMVDIIMKHLNGE